MWQFYEEHPAILARLIWLIRAEYALEISPDTCRRVLERDERIRTCVRRPMETQRISASAEDLIEYSGALKSAIDNVPISFIWKMDGRPGRFCQFAFLAPGDG
jgi:hypothetical protein